jgi:hypothetical protein
MAESMLVGSANVEDAEELFRLVAEHVGDSIARVPDGERGRRKNWLVAQAPFLAGTAELEAVDTGPNRYGSRGTVGKRFRPREGVDVGALTLEFPYAEDAAASFAVFRRLQEEGTLSADIRFQVSMPSAMATCLALIAPEAQREVLPVIERTLQRQVRLMLEQLPPARLAIQWDVAAEFMHMELAGASTFSQDEILAALCRLAGLVPDEVQLGYHLCYGDAPPEPGAKGKHFVEPETTALLVTIANGLAEGAPRRLDWIHVPVPINRDDDSYFAPLAGLRLGAATRLYLGLVHEEDGLEGARRRTATAMKFVRGFGVATECGMQNEPREAHPRILEVQRDLEVAT